MDFHDDMSWIGKWLHWIISSWLQIVCFICWRNHLVVIIKLIRTASGPSIYNRNRRKICAIFGAGITEIAGVIRETDCLCFEYSASADILLDTATLHLEYSTSVGALRDTDRVFDQYRHTTWYRYSPLCVFNQCRHIAWYRYCQL